MQGINDNLPIYNSLNSKKKTTTPYSHQPGRVKTEIPERKAVNRSDIPDRQLIRQALDGVDAEYSLIEIWNRYKKRLYLYIQYKIIRKPSGKPAQDQYIVEDVLQNVFSDALDRLSEYNPQFEVSTWLYTIANKHIMRYIREVNKFNSRTTDIERPHNLNIAISDPATPDMSLELKEFEMIILRFIHSLKRKADQDVFILFIQNLNTKNISEFLGTTGDSVRSRLHRVFKSLKRFLKKNYPEYYNTNIISNIKNLNIADPKDSHIKNFSVLTEPIKR